MLIGQFEVKVGEKARIAFPKRFREVLGDRLIVTYGFENALIVVSEGNWKTLLEGSGDKPFLSSGARDTKRFLLGGASLVELDTQGRFIVPDYLKKYASIKDEVICLGLSGYVEIWDKEMWGDYTSRMQKSISYIAQQLVDEVSRK